MRKKMPEMSFAVKSSVSQQVWDAGQEYYLKAKAKKGMQKNRFKHPVLLTRYFYWLYVSAAKPSETLQEPRPRITLEGSKEGACAVVERMANGKPIRAVIPILDEWELRMWNFVTDSGNLTQPEQVFQFSFYRSLRKDGLSRLIKQNFRAELREAGSDKVRKQGIWPELLRAARIRNWHDTHGIAVELIYNWTGTKNALEGLAFQRMEREGQLARIKAAGLLNPEIKLEREV